MSSRPQRFRILAPLLALMLVMSPSALACSWAYLLASHFWGGLAHVKVRSMLGRSYFAYIDKSGREVFTYR